MAAEGDDDDGGDGQGQLVEGDVTVDGRRWHFYYAGDPAAQTVVVVHGFHGSGAFFEGLLRDLAADGWLAIAPDLPGHGGSDPWDPREPAEEQWRMLVAFLGALEVPPAAIVGHSRGGAVAIQLAARRPERVRALVLVSSGGLPFRSGTLDLVRMVADPGALTPSLVSRLRASSAAAKGYDEARARAMGQGRLERDLGMLLPSVLAPTLVLWGAQDPTVPGDVSERLARGIPGARLVVLDGVGHLPFIEAPDELSRLVRGFLREHLPPD